MLSSLIPTKFQFEDGNLCKSEDDEDDSVSVYFDVMNEEPELNKWKMKLEKIFD